MAGNERNARERQRERDRKKRGTRKYGQAKLKHSRMGVYSCFYAGITICILAAGILTAYMTAGSAAGIVGGMGILSVFLGILGLRAGIKGLREREKNYITCRVGIILNVLVLLLLILIFTGGLR